MQVIKGKSYRHIKTKDIYKLTKIDKTSQATWVYVSKDGKKAKGYGKNSFLNTFEEVLDES